MRTAAVLLVHPRATAALPARAHSSATRVRTSTTLYGCQVEYSQNTSAAGAPLAVVAGRVSSSTMFAPVSYTHLTLPTILRV